MDKIEVECNCRKLMGSHCDRTLQIGQDRLIKSEIEISIHSVGKMTEVHLDKECAIKLFKNVIKQLEKEVED